MCLCSCSYFFPDSLIKITTPQRRATFTLCFYRTLSQQPYQPDAFQVTSMITHLKPDNLKCEVKWALGSITMNKSMGGYEIPSEQFQILEKIMLLKCYTQYATNREDSTVATGLKKVGFHSNPKGKYQRMFKLPHNCPHLKC